MRKLFKHRRRVAVFLLLVFFTEMLTPTIALALTGGPSQPEVEAFEPAQTVQMVDKATGDFTYNIPLMDVGGYPVNISYHSGITMEQEASWVGLGWNINPGVINRSMRGLPDDFSGDSIKKEYNIRTNWTAGVDLGVGFSIFELPIGLGANTGIYYNNYKGVGFKGGVSFSFSQNLGTKESKTSGLGMSMSLGLQFDSQNGIGVMPNVGLSLSSSQTDGDVKTNSSIGLNVGAAYNSRGGLSQVSYGLSMSHTQTPTRRRGQTDKNGNPVIGADGKQVEIKTPGNSRGPSVTRSSSISFASQAITPSIQFPMENFGFTGNFQIGGFIPLYAGEMSISGNITGSYSHQRLAKKEETLPGYGYLYMQDANMSNTALLDFNREKDQPFRKPSKKSGDEGTPIMAVPSYQYDLMSVNGQGISGQYRAMRGDVGSIYDPEVNSWSGSGSVGIDLALGAYASIGIDLNFGLCNTNTNYWKQGNQLADDLHFYGHDNSLYEPSAFVNIGEKTIDEQGFYDALGGSEPIRVQLGGTPFVRTAKRSFDRYKSGQQVGGTESFNTFKKQQRSKRNQVMSFITAGEANIGLGSPSERITLDEIRNYTPNQYYIDVCTNPNAGNQVIPRLQHSHQREKHITEVSVIGSDGQRYVYGIPAYNRTQRDVTFNVDPALANVATAMVGYAPGVDNDRGNTRGMDHFFSRETMPDYAHSYLLTGILSADYVDMTGDGITDDDMGNAVRINYSRAFGATNGQQLYKWRMPYEGDKANYQEGFKTDTKDDKGNYTYGEKEVWYVHSIVSKTMVALFKTSDREDGLGVLGENGGKDTTSKLKKLDRIELYAKSDFINYGQSAVPIKTVHFRYSYKLCPGAENNSENPVDEKGGNPAASGLPNVNTNKGKLTLESLYFTYQKNTKGKLNPYVFNYSSFNPGYHPKKFDRWGNYKDNNGLCAASEVEFPYTVQDKTQTDKFMSAWTLNRILLPTGGIINVQYEADDYAYVQDKRAQQMFEIAGFGASSNFANKSNKLYTATSPSFSDTAGHNRFLFFKSPSGVSVSSKQEVMEKYLQGIDYLYYRVAVKMYSEHADHLAEYVPGYCRIKDYGACPDNIHFWVELYPEPLGNTGQEVVNPIVKSAWQFLRMNLPKLAYPGSENDPTDFASVIKSLIAPLYDIQNMFMGFTRSCMVKRWCRDVVLNRSWLRLNSPDYSKLGGGVRVKAVTISDEWDQMVNGDYKAQYGQVYEYKTDGPNGRKISSGVAEYEPLVGGDENPFRQPLQYKQKTKLAPHSQFYIEFPVGETFFPSANVVYREVKVSSYGSTLVSPEKRTGYTLSKFYTAFDFPISTDYTPMQRYLDKIPSVFQILQLPQIEHFTGSQGFQIELNDMHGKPRSEEVYDNVGEVISKTIYDYYVESPSAITKKVKNEVTVMKPDGTIVPNVSVGKSIEVMTDFRHQSTNQGSLGALITVDLSSVIPPIPVAIPTVFPAISYENTQFRSVVTTKVVRRFGILASTTATQYGSRVTTENLVFDSETGEVLLTKTRNEFDDPIYNFTYPAHLAYEGMGPAYKNTGAEFNRVDFSNGRINSPAGLDQYFTEGDEVLVVNANGGVKLWVINPHHTNVVLPAEKIFVNSSGVPYSGADCRVKIIRSGRRNLSTQPIASVVSLKSPIHGIYLAPDSSDEIINTSSTEYKDEWKIRCDKLTTPDCDQCKAPDCECFYNLLKYVDDNNLWLTRSYDSVFINSCCLDSCFFTDGTYSNLNCDGCKRHFYAIDTNNIMADGYRAVVGRCTISINTIQGGGYNQSLSSLYVPSPQATSVNDTSCLTVCQEYEKTGKYPIKGRKLGGFSRNFEATLTCPSICRNVCIDYNQGREINPYRTGLLGNWRPEKQWVYRGNRTPGSIQPNGQTNIRRDGSFVSYENFWVYDGTEKKFVPQNPLSSKYVDATTITKYNFKGAEIENRDAAGIYSSALFGYLETQAIAVAKNARYKQIGFDGFEDYVFITDCSEPCRIDHFNFRENLDNGCLTHCAVLDSVESHSGHISLKVLGSGSGTAIMQRELKTDDDTPGLIFDNNTSSYKLQAQGCLPKFSPDTGIYHISCWVKEVQNCNNLTYSNCKVKVSFDGSGSVSELVPSGKIIEGWQQIQGSVNVPLGATSIKIELMVLNGVSVNFDDLRIQPFNSSMKTYVYDSRTLRLMAELDENNFASFYEYGDEGELLRVKKETVRGIMTIKENRSVLKKK